MRTVQRCCPITVACLWLTLLASEGWAQLPKVADTRLGVDVVRLQEGQRLYGFILKEDPQSLRMAVRREWLENTYPELLAQWQEHESDLRNGQRREWIERIQTWIDQRPDDEVLQRFLEAELTRLRDGTKGDGAELSPFLTIDLAADEGRIQLRQPADRRRVAGLAFQHGLERVEQRPVSILRPELQAEGVDLTTTVDLRSQLPEPTFPSEREWAARQALIEFHYRQPLEFQGVAESLLRKGDQVDVLGLVTQLLGGGGWNPIGQIGAELGLPEFQQFARRPAAGELTWARKATAEAEREGFRGVLISRLDQNLLSPTVTVTTHFLALESPGNWFEVCRFPVTARADQQMEERTRRIREDPQVQSVLKTFSALGLGMDARVEQALRHGAATQEALSAATRKFYDFLDPYLERLDTPPLELH